MDWIYSLFSPGRIIRVLVLLALITSRKYRVLRITQLYYLIPFILGIFYTTIFIHWSENYFNWYFYYFLTTIDAILYALCFWEIYKFYTGKNLKYVWIVIVLILLLPLAPIRFLTKLTMTFTIVNIFIVLHTSKLLRSRIPMLLLFVFANSFSLVIDVYKLSVTYSQVATVMRTIERIVSIAMQTGMLLIIIWEPLRNNVYKFLLWLREITRPKAVTVTNVSGSQSNQTLKLRIDSSLFQAVDIATIDTDIPAWNSKDRVAINTGLTEIGSFAANLYHVTDGSMQPTLKIGDAVFTSDQALNFGDIESGNIYGIKLAKKEIMFRIIFCDRDTDAISLVPVNSSYKRQHLKQADIQAVYQILSVKKPKF